MPTRRAHALLLKTFIVNLAFVSAVLACTTCTFAASMADPKTESAILEALRDSLPLVDLEFTVRTLNVRGRWAWVHAEPRSGDGSSHFEDVSALLHHSDGYWRVVALPCTEEDNPECLSSPEYFRDLKRRFPELPEDVLP